MINLKNLLFVVALLVSGSTFAVVNLLPKTSLFKQQAKSGKAVLELYSPTCPHCKEAKEPFKQLSEEIRSVKFYAVPMSADDANLARNETGIPLFIVFQNGKEVTRDVGFNNKSELKQFIQSR